MNEDRFQDLFSDNQNIVFIFSKKVKKNKQTKKPIILREAN